MKTILHSKCCNTHDVCILFCMIIVNVHVPTKIYIISPLIAVLAFVTIIPSSQLFPDYHYYNNTKLLHLLHDNNVHYSGIMWHYRRMAPSTYSGILIVEATATIIMSAGREVSCTNWADLFWPVRSYYLGRPVLCR